MLIAATSAAPKRVNGANLSCGAGLTCRYERRGYVAARGEAGDVAGTP